MEKPVNNAIVWAAVCVIVFAMACRQREADPVARSYDRYLYPEDLKGVVPAGVTGEDSIQLTHAFIEQWVRQQAMLHHAHRNVSVNTADLERQVEEYRNGLIVYAYEQALVNEKLDTVVTDEEITEYYTTRDELFVLRQPILKVSYIRLNREAPELDRIKRWLTSTDLKDQTLLEQYCAVYALDYSLRDTSWYYADELIKKIPLLHIGEDRFDQTDRIFEIIENNELYLIILHDSKFRDTRSPLSLVRQDIRNLILNKRKVALLDRMQKSIIEHAKKKNEIEIYK